MIFFLTISTIFLCICVLHFWKSEILSRETKMKQLQVSYNAQNNLWCKTSNQIYYRLIAVMDDEHLVVSWSYFLKIKKKFLESVFIWNIKTFSYGRVVSSLLILAQRRNISYIQCDIFFFYNTFLYFLYRFFLFFYIMWVKHKNCSKLTNSNLIHDRQKKDKNIIYYGP